MATIGRLDFERFDVAGEVIFKIEGDAAPTSQADEEARIGTLAYALKRLTNREDATEFFRCLNVLCADGDARSRQTIASHYYQQSAEQGVPETLKEMGWLAFQLSQLEAVTEVVAEDDCIIWEGWNEAPTQTASDDEAEREYTTLFDEELAAINKLARSHRRSARLTQDDFTAYLDEFDVNGASLEELDAAFATRENLEQYDEGGVILTMSQHERTMACGRLDPEYTEDDLSASARYLAGELRRAYAKGVALDEIWEDLDAQITVLFPVSGKTESGRFYSHANREWQWVTRDVLGSLLADCQADFHLQALRYCAAYRTYHKAVRSARDTRVLGETMKEAYAARQTGRLPLKYFVSLNTAAQLQRIRLEAAAPSSEAQNLLNEIARASEGKRRFYRWAIYGDHQPQHPFHQLTGQEQSLVWQALKATPQFASAQVA